MIFKILFIFLFTNTNEEEVAIENLVGNWQRVCFESDALGFQVSNCSYDNMKLNFSEWNYIEMIHNGDRKFYDFILDGDKLNVFYDRNNKIINDIEIRGDTLIIESDEIYDGLLQRKYYSNSQIKSNYQGVIETGKRSNSTYKLIFENIYQKFINRKYFIEVDKRNEINAIPIKNKNGKKRKQAQRKIKKLANEVAKSIIITIKSNQNLYPQSRAVKLVNKYKSKFKIKPFVSKGGYYCKKCGKYVIKGTCMHKNLTNISGTEFREHMNKKLIYKHADKNIQKLIFNI